MNKGELVLQNLIKKYGDQTVVNDVSVTVAGGEFFSLLGPSGSGKTSTLMMIAGFASLDGGRILLDGRELGALTPQQRGLGMVFQNYALFPHMTVFENIAFPLRVRKNTAKEIRERVGWALDVVRLGDFSSRFPRALSGGQQQRVALARAIVFHPQVVLMDEPLGALDKNLRYQMQVEIKDIQRKLGMTVVYVTHDQEEAMNMSDRIAIMKDGRIDQLGTPRDVYEKPGGVFTAKFLGEANLLQGSVLRQPDLIARYQQALQSVRQPALFIRPERAYLQSPGSIGVDSDEVRISGMVKRVSFLGNLVRHGVDVGASELMTVDHQNNHGIRTFGENEPVIVTWRQHDAQVLENA